MTVNDNLSIEELKDKKSAIAETLKDLQAKIAATGITKGAAYQARDRVNQWDRVQRDKLVSEYNLLQKEVIDINRVIRKQSEQEDFFRQVVKEAIPSFLYDKICEEAKQRRFTGKITKIVLDTEKQKIQEEKIEFMKRTLKEYTDTLCKVRTEISNYIDLHCPEDYNKKIEFLREASAMNTSIQPKNYYLTKRRIINF